MNRDGAVGNLLAPVNTEEFFWSHWQKSPLHIQRADPQGNSHFLSLAELDAYFQLGNLSPAFLRVIKDTADYDLDSWTKVDKRENTGPYRVVDVDKLFALFSRGASIIINAAHTAIPSLARACAALEIELQTGLQPNIYLAPPRAVSFGYHHDSHDVFVLQLSGEKEWSLYDAPGNLEQSCDSNSYVNKQPQHKFELNPGDVLYVPRFTVHHVRSLETASVHITLAVMSKYWSSLVEELGRSLATDKVFLQALPHGLSSAAERAAFAGEFQQRLQEVVARLDAEELLGRLQSDFVRTHTIDRSHRFTDLLQLDQLGLDSQVSLRPGMVWQTRQEANEIEISFSNGQLRIPSFMTDTLKLMLRTEPYAVRDLSGPISDSGKVELVKNFLRAGLLRIEAL